MEEKALNKKALKAAITYIINNFFTKALSVITVPLFSRILSTEEYGMVSNFQSWSSILVVILSLDLYSSIQRAKFDYENNLNEYLSSILTLSTIVVAIVGILSNVFSDFVTNILSMNTFMMNYMYIYILLNCAFEFYQTKSRVELKYKNVTLISISKSILSVIISLILVSIMQDKMLARILGITLPIMIVSILLFIRILLNGKKTIDYNNWKYGLKLSVPLIPHHLSGNILSQCDRIIITKMTNYTENAMYTMSYSIANLVSIIWTSFNGAWTPWFFEKLKARDIKSIQKVSKYYFLIFWMLAMGVVALAPELLKIFAPEEYYESVYVIPPIIAGLIFQFVYSLYVNIEFYYKKNKYIPIGTIISAVINIILNIIFIPKYGYIAAAYTTFISYILLMIFHYYISKKLCTREILFDERYLKIMLLISIILNAAFIILYSQFILLRYILTIAIYIVIFVKERNNIKNILKIIIKR